MEEIITQLTIFARENAPYAYALLCLSAFVENVFPPIPGDTVTLVGAYFVGTGSLSYAGVLLSTTLGSVVGFMALFVLAAKFSGFILDEKRNKWISAKKIIRVNQLFIKYGYWIILANRFLSGIRSVISLSAGLSQLKVWRVVLLAAVSAIIWNGVIIYLGAYIGKSWQEIQAFLNVYNRIILSILGSLLFGYLIYYFWKRKKKEAP